MLDPDYWNMQWDETYVYDFSKDDADKKDDFVPFSDTIQMALEDFDNIVYLSQMAREGTSVDEICLLAGEFKNITNDGSMPFMTQDYDKFNIDLFYKFCRENPIDGTPQDFMYPFINLENADQKELDQFVIGSWV